MKPHVFHPAADEEYTEAAGYHVGIDPNLGGRFYDEMERLTREVRQQPERFWMFDPPVRRHRSTIFPYSVVYLDQPNRVWIVAIMHGKRRSGYWKERMN